MLDSLSYINQSLISNLFYLRTFRNICVNIGLSFFNNNYSLTETCFDFSKRAEELGKETINLSKNRISKNIINSGFLYTDYTLKCEELTEKLFDIYVRPDLTKLEINTIGGNDVSYDDVYLKKIDLLNKKTLDISSEFSDFIEYLINNISNNYIFSYTYQVLFNYFNKLNSLFIRDLTRLQNKNTIDPVYVVEIQYYYAESFKTLSQTIRGLTNPSDDNIITEANDLVNYFTDFENKIKAIKLTPDNIKDINIESLDAANRFKNLVIMCINKQLKSETQFIVEPIFFDNILTNINYFIFVLDSSLKQKNNPN